MKLLILRIALMNFLKKEPFKIFSMIYLLLDTITNRAGTERAVINLANNLHANGHRVSLVSVCTKEGEPSFQVEKGIEVHHLGIRLYGNALARKTVYFKAYRRIKALYKKREPVLLIGTNIFINTILSQISNRGRIFTIGCEHISYDIARPITKRMRGFLYSGLDAVVALTKRDQQSFEAILRGRSKAYVIPNQVSFTTVQRDATTHKQMLAIGRLTYQKGFEFMIEDASRVLRERPDWKLIIVGDGENESMLRKEIASRNMESQIEIHPSTPEIRKYYESSAIYLMTSRFEGLPMVLLEAEAYALPIISYDCPTGPRELIETGRNGFLVPMEAHEDFADKLRLLMDDETLRKKMGQESELMVKSYSPANIYECWKKLFVEIGYMN